MRREIQKLIAEMRELKRLADYRSLLMFENGREIYPEQRARSEGYSSGYHYAILRLELLLDGFKSKAKL